MGKIEQRAGYAKRQRNHKRINEIKANPKMADAQMISDKLKYITNINPFDRSRRREVVEIRSLLVFILNKGKNFGFEEVRDFFEINGKPYDHTSALYAIKQFDTYRRYNTNLNKYLSLFIGDMNDESTKKAILIENIKSLRGESIEKIFNIVDLIYKVEMKNKEKELKELMNGSV